MRAVLLGLLFAVGVADCGLAQATGGSQLCAPRQFWTNAAARACIANAYRQGAVRGYWPSTAPWLAGSGRYVPEHPPR